jgi:two-component system, OmpR family, response regulator
MSELQRIMYVEDDLDIQAVATLALEAVGGYTLKTYESGEKAVAEVLDFMPDLILLDVMMPGMDGPTTLKLLKEIDALKDIPMVFMTAKVQSNEIAHFKSLGAVDVIPKPFDPMNLAGQVEKIWQQHKV